MHDTDIALRVPELQFIRGHSVEHCDKFSIRSRFKRAYRVAIVLVAATLSLSNITHSRANTDLPTSDQPETSSGSLMLGKPGQWQEALLLDSEIQVQVQGLLADMTLTQRFHNDTNSWLDGTYLFPLPADAAVRGLTVRVGEREIKGVVMPRDEATATFDKARDAGQVASVVEQQRPNLFTVKVASIAPGDEVRVSLDVMLAVRYTDKTYQLTLPTTNNPRYTNNITPDAHELISPTAYPDQIRGPRFSLTARISSLDSMSSVNAGSHDLVIRDGALTLDHAPMDRDVVISWKPPAQANAESKIYVSDHGNKRYLQLLLTPPERPTDRLATPGRELILVIDTSGSMAGTPIRDAREALLLALDRLRDKDRFNIIAFNHESYSLFSQSRQANQNHIVQARQFVNDLQADGGTEMRAALSQAMHSPDADRLRQIVFITDGSVGYENELLRQIRRNIGPSRLFTVAIGSAPNHYFIDKAAEAGRGVAESVTDHSQVQQAITRLLTKLEQPVLTNLSVQFTGGMGEFYPTPLPDLYADRPLMLTARIDNTVTGINLAADHDGERWNRSLTVPDAVSSTTDSDNSADAIAIYWAREKIASLMDEQRFAIDTDMHRGQITRLAVDVGLVSAYTSFVAVEPKPSRPANEQSRNAKVANLMPAGNLMESVMLPMGASGADTLRLASIVFALLGTVSLWFSRTIGRPRKHIS